MESVVEWKDLTSLVKESAYKELQEGQMMHADSFHLGDSMSALELMDPKMDAGLVNPAVCSPVGILTSSSWRNMHA
jgi:hypothetical protein